MLTKIIHTIPADKAVAGFVKIDAAFNEIDAQAAALADLLMDTTIIPGNLPPPPPILPGAPVVAPAVSLSGVTSSTVRISWTSVPSATTYALLRNGVLLASVSGLIYSDTGLTPSTTYTYSVAGQNISGNGPQGSATATTAAATVAAPTVAPNLTVSQ